MLTNMSSPIQVYIQRKYNGEYITTSEASELVGRSVVQIQRYRRNGEFIPSKVEEIGKATVYLYSAEDIERLREFISHQKVGRKPKVK